MLVAGPNGSGKTSTTVQLLHNEWAENSLYINPDNIAQEQYGDWNSPVAVLKAAELATKMRYECLRKRQDFVFETVFSSDEKLAFVEEAKKAGFFIRIFCVCTNNPEINVRRITQRYLNGGLRDVGQHFFRDGQCWVRISGILTGVWTGEYLCVG